MKKDVLDIEVFQQCIDIGDWKFVVHPCGRLVDRETRELLPVMPTFVLGAFDDKATTALREYYLGCKDERAQHRLGNRIQEFENWQRDNSEQVV